MPARDGTGPLGQGSRTGRRLGNCQSKIVDQSQASKKQSTQPICWGGRVWERTFGRFCRRRSGNQTNRK